MAFSLTYALGKAGRHARSIAAEARKFITAQHRTLPVNSATQFLYSHSKAIDAVLFRVFYSEPGDRCYPIHARYLPSLLEVTESGFRQVSQAYASAQVVALPLESGTATERRTREELLRTISYLYVNHEPASYWVELAHSPNEAGITAALLTDIAKVLRFNPPHTNQFARDWLSLIPLINQATAVFCE